MRATVVLLCVVVSLDAAVTLAQPGAGAPAAPAVGGAAGAAEPAKPALTKIVPDAVERSAVVRIEATGLPAAVTSASILLMPVALQPGASSICKKDAPDAVAADGAVTAGAITFTVPTDAPLGRYQVCAFLAAATEALPMAPGTRPFRVQAGAVRLTKITPTAVYHDRKDQRPEAGGEQPPSGEKPPGGEKPPTVEKPADADDKKPFESFWVDGAGFSPVAAENLLVIDGHVVPAKIEVSSDPAEPKQLLISDVRLQDEGRGSRQIRIRVGENDSNALALIFSSSGSGTPRLLAFAGLIGVSALLGELISVGLRAAGPQRPRFLGALLLENGAYSLGKLQFYLWTAAGMLGYLFLAFAHSLVQGRVTLPEVPEGLPGIIGISAGTGIASAAIGAISSTKGPAGLEPSVGDLIMTGGVVVADRVQFLVWTIVSLMVFLGLVLTIDPATIDSLPRIPDGLLWLMGLSAGGYLGGKFVRRPSPSIVETTGRDDATSKTLTLVIKGRNLSKDARFAIRENAIAPPSVSMQANNVPPFHDSPVAGSPEDGASDLFKQLEVVIHYATPVVQAGDNMLSLVNPDGQSAKGNIHIPANANESARVAAGGDLIPWRRKLTL